MSADQKYKINFVVEYLLTRTDQLLTSSWCGNVICKSDSQQPETSISELAPKTGQFCIGKNKVTSQVAGNPKFFFVMRTVTSAYIPNIDGHINIANTTYKLTGIVYFNGMHYWCEVLSTQLGYKNGWFFYDGMIKGGRAEYVGETPQCKQLQHVHILVYEQCSTNANDYGKKLSYKCEKLTSIISSSRHVLNLSDNKIKIQNLKAILTHEGIPFQVNSRLEDLKTLVFNSTGSSCTTKNSPNFSHTSLEVDMTTPPSVKKTSLKRICKTPSKFSDYTPERHAPKKFKKHIFSSLKKSSLNKGVTKCVETFKDLVNRMMGPKETNQSSSEDETEQCKSNTVKNPNSFFKHIDEPTEKEIIACKLNNYLSKSFTSDLPYQMVDTKELWQFREFDRFLTPKVKDGGERLEQIRRFVLNFGIDSPLILTYKKENGKVYLAEGNHRLAVGISEGIPYLPTHVTSNRIEPNELGNYKTMTNLSDISTITTSLPEHFGLKVKTPSLLR